MPPSQPPSLHELQRVFAAALIGGEAPALTPWIAARGIDPQARLRIYRHAGYAIHVDALETVFPAVRALIGAACFDGLSTRYTAHASSSSGNLQHFGRDFAAFIRLQPETADYPWLVDVARLEWLRQEALLAAEAVVQHEDEMLRLLTADGAGLFLHLQPHVRLLLATVPALDLWAYARDPQNAAPDPAGPAQCVLVWRRDTCIDMCVVDTLQATCIGALCDGCDLHAALGEHTEPACMAACLQPLFEHALIARIATTPATPANEETCA